MEDGQETPQELALRIFNTAHVLKSRHCAAGIRDTAVATLFWGTAETSHTTMS